MKDDNQVITEKVVPISVSWIQTFLIVFTLFSPFLVRIEYSFDFGYTVDIISFFYSLRSLGGPFFGFINGLEILMIAPIFLLPKSVFVWYMLKYYRNETSRYGLILAGILEETPEIISSIAYLVAPVFSYVHILIPIPMLLLAGIAIIIILPPQKKPYEPSPFQE